MKSSKLFELKEEILNHADFFVDEDDLNDALNSFANEDIGSLIHDLVELIGKYESSLNIESIRDAAEHIPQHWLIDYIESEEVFKKINHLVAIMYLKHQEKEL